MHVTTFYHKVIKVRNQKAAGARGVGAGLLASSGPSLRHSRWQSCWRRVLRLLCLGPPAGNTTTTMKMKMEMKMEMPHACGIIESDMAAM